MNLDAETKFEVFASKRLNEDQIIWLTTVAADGKPNPNPVWFHWDGEKVLTYSRPDSRRVVHIANNPNVCLHLNTDETGDHIVVINGKAQIYNNASSGEQEEAYLKKYKDGLARFGLTREGFKETFSLAYKIKPDNIRGY